MNSILLQAAASSGGGMMNLAFLGLMFVVFYFFMIRPQMKKQKDQAKFREEVGKGDKIVTLGGIHAKILSMNDDNTVTIESEGTKLKIDKSAISMEATRALNKKEVEKK
jgi:preprotein translocase subunit YajC